MTRVGGIAVLASAWLFATACGGRSVDSDPDVSAGGSVSAVGGASTGGTSTGGASDDRCAAMDARSSGDRCAGITGYAYDGRVCAAVVCGCVGADCAELFPSIDACDLAYASCYAARGLSLACTTHADCTLISRRCCPGCKDPTHDELIAVAVGEPTPRATGVCWGDPDASCGMCRDFSVASIYPACFDGTCRMLDVSAQVGCASSDDCRVTTKDCCECGGDFSDAGRIAVNTSFRAPDYCSPNTSCPRCAPNPPAPGQCDLDLKVCKEGHFGLK